MDFLPGLITVITLHAIAVMMPGPDFALILKIALQNGKKNALWASLGICLGLSVHITYSILGVAWISEKDNIIYYLVLALAGSYLIYLGGSGLYQQYKSKKDTTTIINKNSYNHTSCSVFTSFRQGWLTNALNPKAGLFFIALFSLVVNESTPLWVKSVYVLETMIVTLLWFAALSCLLTSARAQKACAKMQHQLLGISNTVLLIAGLLLLIQII